MFEEQKELDTYLMKSEMDIKSFLSAPGIHSVSKYLPAIAVTPYRFSFDHPTACGTPFFVHIACIYFQNLLFMCFA